MDIQTALGRRESINEIVKDIGPKIKPLNIYQKLSSNMKERTKRKLHNKGLLLFTPS
jgi:hypothetical protein